MFDFLSTLVDTSDFPPRWHCGAWTPAHGWLHILSDLAIWSAYLAIPCVLAYFILRRKDIPFRFVFLLFGAFILACGSTHLMEALIFWWPAYRLSGVIKLITAIVSLATVFALIRVVPMALAMRNPEELEREVSHRRRAEDALQRSLGELERRVDERTVELASANATLRAEVSDRQRAEESLLESRRFIVSSLDALTAHIGVLDEEGNILMVNEAWRRFSRDNGYLGTDDGVGMNYLRACGEDVHDEGDQSHLIIRGIRDVMDGRLLLFETEYPCHGPDERRWFSMRVTRFDSRGAVRTVVAHEDISRRKLAEDDVRAAKDEAEEANRAKTQFLAVLSHELRTPLNPILLATTSMLEEPPTPGELRPALEMVRRNVNLQSRLIDDLLDVTRIVRGKMPLHWEIADGHELMTQAVKICRSDAFGSGIQLALDLQAADYHINADPARFQQLIWNLVKNAVKFTPEGGEVTIRTRNVAAADAGGGRLLIEVSDTGIGIDPEVQHRIFDPFQQAETNITRKFGGLGLGLAICKGIVDGHGGTIAVESRGEDQGSTFRVTFLALPKPVVEGDGETGGSPKIARSEPLSALRILVVEDDPTTLRLMARLLARQGHVITTANSIASAIESFEAMEFDLIVSDIGLPDGTGLDLMRRVTALRGRIPAIALTGYGMEDDVIRSRDAGFTTHMTKPIDFTKLDAVIRQVIH